VAFPVYLDENIESIAIAMGLQARGVDVLRSLEAGMSGRSDDAQLEFATSLNRPLLTANRGDFASLHRRWLAQGRSHGGIIIAVQEESIGTIVRRMMALHSAMSASDMYNRLEWLTNWPG
jgi:hypothetical protein